MQDLKIASVTNIINYANLLIEKGYYEKAFRVYERATEQFNWPHKYEVWVSYLTALIEQYGGAKLERVREVLKASLFAIPA